MIEQSDIRGRLNLLRYGLVVVVVVAFLVALLAPIASLRNIEGITTPPITDFIDEAIIAAVVVAILSGIVYYVYSQYLHRTVAKSDSAEATA